MFGQTKLLTKVAGSKIKLMGKGPTSGLTPEGTMETFFKENSMDQALISGQMAEFTKVVTSMT